MNKRELYVFLFFLFLINFLISPASASNHDPVAYWKFDEGSGTTVTDSSGNGNDGAIYGATYVDGKSGKALNFDGVDDYVGILDSVEFRPDTGTIELWFKPSETYNSSMGRVDFIGKGISGNYVGEYNISIRAGRVAFVIYTGIGSTWYIIYSDADSWPANEWHNVAVTFGSGGMKMFIDGVQQSETSAYTGGITAIRTTIMGRHEFMEDNYFNGLIDEVKIYNYARTAEQIAADASGLVGYWKFDEGSGTTAADSSGNGNDGTIYGATYVDGKSGKALNFDGVDDYVSFSDSSATDIQGPFTLTVWAKADSFVDHHTIIEKRYDGNNDNNANYDLMVRVPHGDTYFGFGTSEGGYFSIQYKSFPSINVYHHYAGVYDGSYIYLYIDGILVGKNSATGTPYNGNNLNIGRSTRSGANRFWDGAIDEVKIYNYARTAEQIALDAAIGTLSGKVTRADGTTPIYGAVVEILQASEVNYSTKTDTAGEYAFSLMSDTYDVRVSSTGYLTETQTDKVVTTQQTTTVDFVLSIDPQSLGSISGKITQQDGATPIIDASIYVLQAGTTIQNLLSPSDGIYLASNLNPGTYDLHCTKSGYNDEWNIGVVVNQGETATVNFSLDLSSSNYGRVSGKVTKSDGITAIQEALVEILRLGVVVSSKTAAVSGNFEIVIDSGAYDIRASAYGYITSTQTNKIVYESSTTVVNFSLESRIVDQPYPVGDLIATPVELQKIRLDWTKSPSSDVSYYKIYYNEGSIIDFSSSQDMIPAINLSWTSSSLTLGQEYVFSVRPVNTSGVENLDTNMVAKAVPTLNTYNVKAVIKVPKTGRKVSGNRLTVIAELIQGSYIDYIRFEYRKSDSFSWKFMPPVLSLKFPNPDPQPPYFIHWDVSGLANGDYDLRAVAFDKFGGYDVQPTAVTITVDHVNPESVENVDSNGVYSKSEKVFEGKDNIIKFSCEEADNIVELNIPEGALNTALAKIDIITNPEDTPRIPEHFSSVSNIYKVTLDNNQTDFSNDKEAVMSIPYNINVSNAETSKIRGYSYNSITKKWEQFAKYQLDKENKKLSLWIEHFSYLALFSNTNTDISTAHPYPNPFKPNSGLGHDKITFTGLTNQTRLRIFNIAGELVYDKQQDTYSGELEWYAVNQSGKNLASGVYIYMINEENNKTKKGKLVIIR